LSTWIKKGDEIKQKYLTVEMGSQRKKSRGAKFPEVVKALLTWFKNAREAREQNVTVSGESFMPLPATTDPVIPPVFTLGPWLDCSVNVMNLAIPPELGPGPSPDPFV
jgi:hypothetical protein